MIKKSVYISGIIILALVIVLSIIGNKNLSVNAKEKEIRVENIKNIKKDLIKSVNNNFEDNRNIKIEKAIIIKDKAFTLYPEYIDKNKELTNIKIRCNRYLNILSDYYVLDEISDENWEDYYYCMKRYLGEEDRDMTYNETSREYVELQQFFDIYENTDANINIQREVGKIHSINDIKNNKKLVNELPRDIIKYLNRNSSTNITLGQVENFDVIHATLYARKYATSPNKKVYKTCKADCTNFASQIINIGGVQMSNEWKAYSKSKKSGEYTKYTFAWCNADGFVKYHGTSSVYDNFAGVTRDAKVGNIIAYDTTNDNDWDHVGYIVDTKEYSENLGYTDLEIAQHSRDYCAWISDNENGWDTLEESYKKVVFSLVSFN